MMQSDLQAIMQRRRQRTDSGFIDPICNGFESRSSPQKAPQKSPPSMNKDLQAIMDRRRILSENFDDTIKPIVSMSMEGEEPAEESPTGVTSITSSNHSNAMRGEAPVLVGGRSQNHYIDTTRSPVNRESYEEEEEEEDLGGHITTAANGSSNNRNRGGRNPAGGRPARPTQHGSRGASSGAGGGGSGRRINANGGGGYDDDDDDDDDDSSRRSGPYSIPDDDYTSSSATTTDEEGDNDDHSDYGSESDSESDSESGESFEDDVDPHYEQKNNHQQQHQRQPRVPNNKQDPQFTKRSKRSSFSSAASVEGRGGPQDVAGASPGTGAGAGGPRGRRDPTRGYSGGRGRGVGRGGGRGRAGGPARGGAGRGRGRRSRSRGKSPIVSPNSRRKPTAKSPIRKTSIGNTVLSPPNTNKSFVDGGGGTPDNERILSSPPQQTHSLPPMKKGVATTATTATTSTKTSTPKQQPKGSVAAKLARTRLPSNRQKSFGSRGSRSVASRDSRGSKESRGSNESRASKGGGESSSKGSTKDKLGDATTTTTITTATTTSTISTADTTSTDKNNEITHTTPTHATSTAVPTSYFPGSSNSKPPNSLDPFGESDHFSSQGAPFSSSSIGSFDATANNATRGMDSAVTTPDMKGVQDEQEVDDSTNFDNGFSDFPMDAFGSTMATTTTSSQQHQGGEKKATELDPFDTQVFSAFDTPTPIGGGGGGMPSTTPASFDLQSNPTFQSPPTFDTAAFEPTSFTSFDMNNNNNNDNNHASSLLDNAMMLQPTTPNSLIGSKDLIDQFSPPRSKKYDMTPLKNIPQHNRTQPSSSKLHLLKRNIFSHHNFKCDPIINPLNGNIIFCGAVPNNNDTSANNNNNNDNPSSNNPSRRDQFQNQKTNQSNNQNIMLSEIDPKRNNLQILSIPVLSSELHRKVTSKYGLTAVGVDSVFKLSLGIHKSHGQPKLRVLAVLDLAVLDTREILRVIVIWQWGYGNTMQPVAVQHVLTPPSGTDYMYDPLSVCAGDNIIFIAGASTAKGPCIFMCKPTIRESWSANFLGGAYAKTKIVIISVARTMDRKYPYLAISMLDGSVSVWTYRAALNAIQKRGEPIRKLLFPLCRLEGMWVLSKVEPIELSNNTTQNKKKRSGSMDNTAHTLNNKDPIGYCTHLEWMPPQQSLSSPLLLAASFQSGMAIFHISLPVKFDSGTKTYKLPPEPTISTMVQQTPQIWPFSAIRWKILQEKAHCSWLDLGPYGTNMCLGILLHGKNHVDDAAFDNNNIIPEVGRVVFTSINIPQYRKGHVRPKTSLAPLRVLGSMGWRTKTNDKVTFPLGLLGSSSLRSIICHYKNGIFTLSPSSSSSLGGSPNRENNDPCVMSVGHPISSNPPGLNSMGEVVYTDSYTHNNSNSSKKHKDKGSNINDEGILHIMTLIQCDRMKNDGDNNIFTWGCPTYRHWLCCSLPGDSKESQSEETKEERSVGGCSSEFGNDDETTVCGGGSADIICDLSIEKLAGLVPYRIVRCPGIAISAVLFRPALGNNMAGGLSLECVSIALIDDRKSGTILSSKPNIDILDGRDILFLPRVGDDTVRILLLSRDGSSLSVYNYEANKWKKYGKSYRPILGVDVNDMDKYIECLRIFVVRGEEPPTKTVSSPRYGLIMVGRKYYLDDHSNYISKNCIVRGPLHYLDELTTTEKNVNTDVGMKNEDGWTKLLPEIEVADHIAWLLNGEEIFSLICLPPPLQKAQELKLAVATSKRVIILSPELKIIAEILTTVSSDALVPMGSCTVSFCTKDGKVRYLSCLEKRFSSGIIANLPLPRFGYCPYLLTAIRPDRFQYLPWHSGANFVEKNGNADSFLLPLAVTRPALLLEPMVANAVSEGLDSKMEGQSSPLLRGVVEKFGRKVKTMTHNDEEGIGLRGAGITARVYEIFSHYGLKHPASWLLTGSCPFDRSATTKILCPWLPLSAKAEGALNADALLHLLASGDEHFTNYIRSPDENVSSTLPRPSDPMGYYCREFANELLSQGDVINAMKLLDLAGTESTDSMLFQLVTSLQMNKNSNVTDILKFLCAYDEKGFGSQRSSSSSSANTSLAALAVSLRLGGMNSKTGSTCMSEENIQKWIKPLAPSLQRGTTTGRVRQRILDEGLLAKVDGGTYSSKNKIDTDRLFLSPCNESRHVWNEGPNKEKENILLLDRVEDWLGRRRPVILGKEGAEDAAKRGETVLGNIINSDSVWGDGDDTDDDSSEEDAAKHGWAEGVGEARDDEDNISGYFRFSEGEDEDNAWRTKGFTDLSSYENKAVLVGDPAAFDVQETSSSVDEGEPGKAHILHDLIFERAGDSSEPCALAVAATRGNSLDVGMLHGSDREGRQRCTLEFWYFLPPADMVKGPIVLARRTMGPTGDDLQKVCEASNKKAVLWELILLKSGELEFRTCSGTKLLSSINHSKSEPKSIHPGTDDYSDDETPQRKDIATWERWNHACLVFSCRSVERVTDCYVTLYMKGFEVASTLASMAPSGAGGGIAKLDEMMQKSYLVFGLNHAPFFRLTELRVWACERDVDDTKMMMYEYLKAASKKRFKVKIKGKKKGGSPAVAAGGTSSFLVPPKGGSRLTPPRSGIIAPPKGSGALAPPKGSVALAPPKGSVALAPPKGSVALAPPKGSVALAPPKGSGALAPPKGSGALAPPKGSGALAPPKSSARLAPPKGMVTPGNDSPATNSTPGTLEMKNGPLLSPPPSEVEPSADADLGFTSSAFPSTGAFGADSTSFDNSATAAFDTTATGFGKSFGSFDGKAVSSSKSFASPKSSSQQTVPPTQEEQATPSDRVSPSFEAASPADSTHSTLWDTALPLSEQVRHSAAAALIRGPPAARHFGGNRGGLMDFLGNKRSGVGGIAICGSEKTIVWRDGDDPPALTYPIGASGAIVSDRLTMEEESEFLCCFLAKEKRMVVFELKTRTVVVELQMTTKLNFWRYIPPEACEDGLCFMLVTPVGGFHWMPLNDSPRPRQVWKRGQDLQGKKIVSYEEGGSNGMDGIEIMSTVGLICVTSASTNFCLEAWIIPICGDSFPILASNETLGAALCCPTLANGRFQPNLVAAFEAEDGVLLSVNTIIEPGKGSVDVGEIIATIVIDTKDYKNVDYSPPTMAMGMFPEAIICTLGNLIAVIMRRKGLMIAYDLEKDGLHLVAEEDVGCFVVDAVMRCSSTNEGGTEIVMLLSDSNNPKDGRVICYNFRSAI